jgi:FkbM family methyltransferase
VTKIPSLRTLGNYLRLLFGDIAALARRHALLISWSATKRLHDTVTINTRIGRFTVLTSDEAIGAHLYQRGEFEIDLIRRSLGLLRGLNLVPPAGSGVLLDVGANNGVTSIAMLTLGEMGEAIAIEPEPRNFLLLQENVAQNDLVRRTTLLNYAAAESAGQLEFELSNVNSGDHRVRRVHRTASAEQHGESSRPVISVGAERLDKLILDLPGDRLKDISLIWIDVQGYEGYVFCGATEILSRGIPVVTELWPYGLHRAGMTNEDFCAIAKRHWSAYWVLRRGRFVKYPIEWLPSFLDELGADGEYDNIIFVP